jgi:uncharacterized protein YdeI (YjbR/CyaY-like superfamily)
MRHHLLLNHDVTKFLDSQPHPFRAEIEQLRTCILQANSGLTENIKWNGPITMRIHPPKQVQLIFHTGAKVNQPPKNKLIEENSGLLQWKTADRAVATFQNMTSIEENKETLTDIINKWISATT